MTKVGIALCTTGIIGICAGIVTFVFGKQDKSMFRELSKKYGKLVITTLMENPFHLLDEEYGKDLNQLPRRLIVTVDGDGRGRFYTYNIERDGKLVPLVNLRTNGEITVCN